MKQETNVIIIPLKGGDECADSCAQSETAACLSLWGVGGQIRSISISSSMTLET